MTIDESNDISSNKTYPRIVFMGSPDFAVPSLDALLSAGFPVVGVVTAPDKPAGRGLQVSHTAVKKYALEQHLQILQPEKLKAPSFLEELRALQADLQIVVAFRMLPEIVWKMPRLGTVNLHGSLLPEYRGAAPINWAIINGERETGLTTFKLQQEIDTGNILLQESLPIGENETAGELHDRMKMIGAALVVKTTRELADGQLTEIKQPDLSREPALVLKTAPKIFTETCRINWSKNVDDIHNLIRGLSPFPGAFTVFHNKILKILRSEREYSAPNPVPGIFESDGKHFLKFACANGYVLVKELQMEGKRKMGIEDFLRGYRFDDIKKTN